MRRLGDILDLKDADGGLASRAIAGLAFDSRKIAPGELFFALSGAKDDGLEHVGEAVAKAFTMFSELGMIMFFGGQTYLLG